MLGEHCVSSRSKTQSVIATSTGEAELYAICSGLSQGLSLIALLGDLDVKVKVRLGIDASAGKAMASRKDLASPSTSTFSTFGFKRRLLIKRCC